MRARTRQSARAYVLCGTTYALVLSETRKRDLRSFAVSVQIKSVGVRLRSQGEEKMSIIAWLVVGLIAGWVANMVMSSGVADC